MLSLRKTFSLVLSLLISLALLMSSGPLSLRAESEERDLPVRERCSLDEIRKNIIAPRLPELLFDSADAKRFNAEIEEIIDIVEQFYKENTVDFESEYEVRWSAKRVGEILSLYLCIKVPEDKGRERIEREEVLAFDLGTGKRVGDQRLLEALDLTVEEALAQLEETVYEALWEHELLVPLFAFSAEDFKTGPNDGSFIEEKLQKAMSKLNKLTPLKNLAYTYADLNTKGAQALKDETVGKGGFYLVIPRYQNACLSLYDGKGQVIDQGTGVAILMFYENDGQIDLRCRYQEKELSVRLPERYGLKIKKSKGVSRVNIFGGNILNWRNYGLFGQALLPMVQIETTGLYDPPFVTPRVSSEASCYRELNKLSQRLKMQLLPTRGNSGADSSTVDYTAFIQDGILSFYIVSRQEGWLGQTEKQVFNFDVNNQEFASDKAVLDKINETLKPYDVKLSMDDLKVALSQSPLSTCIYGRGRRRVK